MQRKGTFWYSLWNGWENKVSKDPKQGEDQRTINKRKQTFKDWTKPKSERAVWVRWRRAAKEGRRGGEIWFRCTPC